MSEKTLRINQLLPTDIEYVKLFQTHIQAPNIYGSLPFWRNWDWFSVTYKICTTPFFGLANTILRRDKTGQVDLVRAVIA